MPKKNHKTAPKPSGGDAVCELANLLRYRAGLNLISTQQLPCASTPTDADSTLTTKGKATLKRFIHPFRNFFSKVCRCRKCNLYQFDEQGAPQQDEPNELVSDEAEATPVQSAHGPLITSPTLDPFEGKGLSASSDQVGSAYPHVLVSSELFARNDTQLARSSHS